jgi:hypothetical protein
MCGFDSHPGYQGNKMSHYLSELAFECEDYIVSGDDRGQYNGKVPAEIQKFIDLVDGDIQEFMKEYGVPTAIAKHPKHGWVILGCGQGPFIMWMENTVK